LLKKLRMYQLNFLGYNKIVFPNGTKTLKMETMFFDMHQFESIFSQIVLVMGSFFGCGISEKMVGKLKIPNQQVSYEFFAQTMENLE
jgi:hypothetical protein